MDGVEVEWAVVEREEGEEKEHSIVGEKENEGTVK